MELLRKGETRGLLGGFSISKIKERLKKKKKTTKIATLLWQPMLGDAPRVPVLQCGACGALSSAGAELLRAVSTGSSPSLASASSGRRRCSPQNPCLCPCAQLVLRSCGAPRCAASSPPARRWSRGTACRCSGPACAPTRCGCWRSALESLLSQSMGGVG